MVDKNEKAPILNNVAKVFTEGREPQKGKRLLQAVLRFAGFSSQQIALKTVAVGAL